MKSVQVPTFDEFNNYAFIGYKTVKIKNKPDFKDVNKITRLLPGIAMGGIGRKPLQDLLTKGEKDVRSFYDARQNTRKLKGYKVFISFK